MRKNMGRFLILTVFFACLLLAACLQGALADCHHTLYFCDDTTCYYCGEAYTGESEWDVWSHRLDYSKYFSDDTHHWYVCGTDGCDGVGSKSTHRANCDSQTTCYVCKAENITADYVSHNVDYIYRHDDTHHWLPCKVEGCDYRYRESTHKADCSAPTVCKYCEAEDVTAESVTHSVNYDEYTHDDTHHWYPCRVEGCDYRYGESQHYAYCTTPTVCVTCDATDITAGDLSHDVDYDHYGWDTNGHWYKCSNDDCDYRYDYSYSHTASCTTPTTCETCGGTDVTVFGYNIKHSVDYENYSHDDTQHWHACTAEGCDYRTYVASHSAPCTASTLCETCAAQDVEIEIYHDWNYDEYKYDDTQHWNACRDCDEKYEWSIGNHRADCTDPTTCSYCGAEDVTIDTLNHQVDYSKYVYNDEQHGYGCSVEGCDYITSLANHSAECNTPTVCRYCGAEDIVVNYLNHQVDYSTYKHDATHHWYGCSREGCDYAASKYTHYADCDAPTVCEACEATDITANTLYHSYDWEIYYHDEKYHWYECTGCGQKDGQSKHSADCDKLGECCWCGAEYTGTSVYHDYEWNVYESDGTHHWNVCNKCEAQVNKAEHYASCQTPTVCSACDAECSNVRLNHSYDYSQYGSDEKYHWYECKYCGAAGSTYRHTVSCISNELCTVCGAECKGVDIDHNYTYGEYETNEAQHWYLCKDCNKKISVNTHSASCTDPHTCSSCGVEYNGSSVSHSYDWNNYQHDDKYHWVYCKNCNKENRSEHGASCSEPDKCDDCGESDVTIGYLYHSYSDEYETDATHHWNRCENCDLVIGKGKHWAYCDEPDVCADCGVEYTGSNYSHHTDYYTYETDADCHWRPCLACGEICSKGDHRYICGIPGICGTCGADYEGTNVQHQYNYSEYKSDGTYHWNECTGCGYKVNKNRHAVNCSDPDTCHICGAEVESSANVEVSHATSSEYKYDDYAHWQVCKDCEEEVYIEDHFESCSNPGVCYVCGQTDVELYTSHNWGQMEYDENEHWAICDSCNEEIYREEHAALCTRSGVCDGCGITYDGENITHYWGGYVSEGDYHWVECSECGEPVYEKEEHSAYCDAPGICVDCGAEFEGDGITHRYTAKDRKYDDTYHWYECSGCDSEVYKNPHYAMCDEPDVCTICGVDYTGDDISHYWPSSSKYETDSKYHWLNCTKCGDLCYKDEHSVYCDDPDAGKCITCGIAYTGSNYTHKVEDWEAIQHDATHHWWNCTECDDKAYMYEHEPSEEDPDKCYCGASLTDSSIPGDVDKSKDVNVKDALALLRYVKDKKNTIDKEAADVNDDSKINSKDTKLLLKYLADWGVTLK